LYINMGMGFENILYNGPCYVIECNNKNCNWRMIEFDDSDVYTWECRMCKTVVCKCKCRICDGDCVRKKYDAMYIEKRYKNTSDKYITNHDDDDSDVCETI